MLDHLFGSVVVGAGLLISAALSPFGVGNFNHVGSTTKEHEAGMRSSFGGEGHRNASTTPAMIACVKAAVVARESSIASALSTFNSSLSSAYSARASALSSAYGQTTADSVRSAVKAAWETFKNSVKDVRKTWNSSQKSAWQTFRTATKACGASTTISDSQNDFQDTKTQE